MRRTPAAALTRAARFFAKTVQAADVPIAWEEHHIPRDKVDPRTNSMVTREALDSVLVRAPPAPAGRALYFFWLVSLAPKTTRARRLRAGSHRKGAERAASNRLSFLLRCRKTTSR